MRTICVLLLSAAAGIASAQTPAKVPASPARQSETDQISANAFDAHLVPEESRPIGEPASHPKTAPEAPVAIEPSAGAVPSPIPATPAPSAASQSAAATPSAPATPSATASMPMAAAPAEPSKPAAPQPAAPAAAPAATANPVTPAATPAPKSPPSASTLPAPAAAPAATPQPAPPPALAVIRGQLSLSSGGRPLRPQEAVDAVVYYRSSVATPVAAPTQPYVMSTERKTFTPRVLPVPVGATVRFPNNDPILHNVFSTAKEANFDLGLYGKGDGESHRFTQAGVIRVFCNVHHAMVAHVLVMDTPHFVKPDAQGRFRLANVPEGPGELFVWHERSQLWRKAYVVGTDGDVTVPLELSKRKIPPHLNKFGQPYRRTRPDEY